MTETDPDKRMRDIMAGGDVNVDKHSTTSFDNHSSKDDHSTDIAAGTINVYRGTHRGLIVAILVLIGIIVAGVIVGGVMFMNMSNTSAQDYTGTTIQPGTTTQPITKVPTTVPEIVYHTVSFNTDGYGSIPTQTVMDGEYVSRPSLPSRDGYTFAGWYTSPSYTTKWNFNQPVTSDLDLYAKWTIVLPTTYLVSFNTGGYGSIASQTVNEGEFASSPEIPTRNGFIFDGWYTSTAYTTKWNFNQPITTDMTLFAKWTASTHTINFNTGGYGSIASQTVNDGYYASYPTTPTRSGFTFDGWYTSPTYTTKWDFNQPITADMTLYAKWTAPEGSAENPILVSSASDFLKIYQKPSLHYKLTDDIDLTGYTIPQDTKFSGTLDGNNHKVTGDSNGGFAFKLETTKYGSTKYFGLFSVNSGTIKNLNLEKFSMDGGNQDYVGISDKKQYAYFGSIAGMNEGRISNVTISNCKIENYRMWGAIGLISGLNKGTVNNCKITGGKLSGNCDIGGVVGSNEGKIVSCSISGDGGEFISYSETSWVIHTGYNGRSIGGIAGDSFSNATVESCSVNNIKISYDLRIDACHIGSVCGWNAGKVSGCSVTSVSPSLENCGVNKGTVS